MLVSVCSEKRCNTGRVCFSLLCGDVICASEAARIRTSSHTSQARAWPAERWLWFCLLLVSLCGQLMGGGLTTRTTLTHTHTHRKHLWEQQKMGGQTDGPSAQSCALTSACVLESRVDVCAVESEHLHHFGCVCVCCIDLTGAVTASGGVSYHQTLFILYRTPGKHEETE